jgi:DNA-binding FadR family transcriptional regulator
MTASRGKPSDGRAGDAVFRPVRAGNAFEETVERLVQAIRLGLVAPGERLPPERELATRLAVSRVTLREAIRALQQAGYVRSRRGRYGGSFVIGPPPSRTAARALAGDMGEALHDVLTLRDVLEVGAAEAAARQRLGDADRVHLREHLAACLAAGPADYRRLDSRLHLAIAEVVGAPSLTAAVADVRVRVNELLDAIPLLTRNIGHSNTQHDAIVAAVLDGDAQAARRRMAEHLDGSAALLRGFLA